MGPVARQRVAVKYNGPQSEADLGRFECNGPKVEANSEPPEGFGS